MAWLEFYMQSTGSNKNAGSTTDDGALTELTAGNWAGATRTFTKTGATGAFSAGDWVAVFADGATETSYIGKVSSANANDVVLDASWVMGTAPTDGTGNRTIRRGGAWASPGIFNTVFRAGTWWASATRINIKTVASSSYSRAANDDYPNRTSTYQYPMWLRGYKTTPGDCDSDPTLERPKFLYTSGRFRLDAGEFIVWNLDVESSSTTQSLMMANGSRQWFHQCHFNATANDADNSPVLCYSAGSHYFTNCKFESTHGAAILLRYYTTNDPYITCSGCEFIGGLNAYVGETSPAVFHRCRFRDQAGDVFQQTSAYGRLWVTDCSFHSPVGDVVDLGGNAPNAVGALFLGGNVFADAGGYVMNQSGTAAWYPMVGNTYYNNLAVANGLAEQSGGRSTLEANYTDSVASPFTDAANGDFRPASGALGNQWPASFLGAAAYSGKGDSGAVQARASYITNCTAANIRYGVVVDDVTGALQIPNSGTPTGTQDTTSDGCVVSGNKYGSPERTGSAIIPGAASGSLAIARETTIVHGGTGTSAKLTPSSTSVAGYWDVYVVASGTDAHILDFWWAKDAAGDTITLKISIYDVDSGAALLTDEVVDVSDSDTDWHHKTDLTDVHPASAGLLRVRFTVQCKTSTGNKLYIDDVTVI